MKKFNWNKISDRKIFSLNLVVCELKKHKKTKHKKTKQKKSKMDKI